MFYVGQLVVALTTARNEVGQSITEGTIYPVDGIHECNCGLVMLDVGIKDNDASSESRCRCGKILPFPICWANSKLFAPLEDWQHADELVNQLVESTQLQEI